MTDPDPGSAMDGLRREILSFAHENFAAGWLQGFQACAELLDAQGSEAVALVGTDQLLRLADESAGRSVPLLGVRLRLDLPDPDPTGE